MNHTLSELEQLNLNLGDLLFTVRRLNDRPKVDEVKLARRLAYHATNLLKDYDKVADGQKVNTSKLIKTFSTSKN